MTLIISLATKCRATSKPLEMKVGIAPGSTKIISSPSLLSWQHVLKERSHRKKQMQMTKIKGIAPLMTRA
jgi:hypothetical protein